MVKWEKRGEADLHVSKGWKLGTDDIFSETQETQRLARRTGLPGRAKSISKAPDK